MRGFELDLLRCQAWIADLAHERGEPALSVQLELQARLLRFADALTAMKGDPNGRRPAGLLGEGGLSKVEQLAVFIAQHYCDPIRIEDLAGEVGLHPNYAMSLFKKTFNLTINEFLTQHRISHAQRLLATTDDKIIDIALDAGYPTLSRFYDAFNQACGCPPGAYRRDHRVVQ